MLQLNKTKVAIVSLKTVLEWQHDHSWSEIVQQVCLIMVHTEN